MKKDKHSLANCHNTTNYQKYIGFLLYLFGLHTKKSQQSELYKQYQMATSFDVKTKTERVFRAMGYPGAMKAPATGRTPDSDDVAAILVEKIREGVFGIVLWWDNCQYAQWSRNPKVNTAHLANITVLSALTAYDCHEVKPLGYKVEDPPVPVEGLTKAGVSAFIKGMKMWDGQGPSQVYWEKMPWSEFHFGESACGPAHLTQQQILLPHSTTQQALAATGCDNVSLQLN